MSEQFNQVSDTHSEWFISNIARCERERKRAFGDKEKRVWSDAIATYRHLAECKLHHQPALGDDFLCKLGVEDECV